MHDEDSHHHHGDDDHYHEEHDLPLDKQPLWILDNIELKSVGIDIGSSGTRVAFSRIKLQRDGINLSSSYHIISRELIHHSDARFTPYVPNYELIDGDKLGKIIDEEYAAAKIKPGDIDTGALILTGEAVRRKNAQTIGNILALRSGEFVTVSAGHNLEARLAAYGSGAVALSQKMKSKLLNIDIGGGTTKFSLIDNGRVVDTCAVAVGGRLIVFDNEAKIIRLEPSAIYVAKILGLSWKLGEKVSLDEVGAVARWMADAVLTVADGRVELPPSIRELSLTPITPALSKDIAGVVVSGGVGEYVYGTETRYFNDLGKKIGESIAQGLHRLGLTLLPATERLRATVIGVSEYTIQVSGNTIYVSDPESLPVRDVQVLHPNLGPAEILDSETLARSILKHFSLFDLTEGEKMVALMFHWTGDSSYERLEVFADGVIKAMSGTISGKKNPLIVVFDADVGLSIGAMLREKSVSTEIICIDGILLQDFDFIDIGRTIEPNGVVPVTIKSLAFESAYPRGSEAM